MATQLFQLVNLIAIAGWIILISFPAWKNTPKGILNGVVMGLCLFYLCLIGFWISHGAKGSFDSLINVRAIFADDLALVAGWVHYLAFDLFVGLWITQNALKSGIARWILIPIQILTFMLGPLGLFCYMIIRRSLKNELVSNL